MNMNMNNNDVLECVLTPSKKGLPFSHSVKNFSALLTLKLPEEIANNNEQERQPIDIVCVVDVSGSMAPHMQHLKECLAFVCNQLRDGDCLCIVTYHSVVSTVVPLTKITHDSRLSIHRTIESLTHRGSTNLAGGLFQALHNVMVNRKNELASVLLLTDGLANHGITKTSEITRRMRSADFIESYRGDHTTFNHVNQVSGDLCVKSCSVYTFGFGANHNIEMLSDIADTGRGLYTYIETPECIGEAFSIALGGLKSIVAQNIEINLEDGMYAKISKVKSKYPDISYTSKGVKIVLPDMLAGERRDILIELDIHELKQELVLEPILSVAIQHYNRINQCTTKSDTKVLGIHRPSQANLDPSMDVTNLEVDAQVNRNNAVDAMDNANRLGDANQIVEARKCIDDAISSIEESASRHEESVRRLLDDLRKAREGLRDRNEWQRKGNKMMKGFYHGHSKQRANVQCMQSYSAPAQKNALASWFSRK